MIDLQKELAARIAADPGNFLAAEIALDPALAGLRFFDAPLMGVAAADDPLFETMRRPEAIGPWFRLPGEWLPGAKSVISFFFPYSDEVKRSEDPLEEAPSPAWLHARIDGEPLLNRSMEWVVRQLEEAGYRAMAPTADTKEFWSVWAPGTNPDRMADPSVGYTSPWSERHVGFVCGLGTFGLSAGLITEKGICGRLRSVVTTAELPPKPRAYTEVYEYCTHCNRCAEQCPAGAIDPVTGKHHAACGERINASKILYAPRYGCGKCQVGVPCMSRIPKKPSKNAKNP